jgi:hypothetical protein
VRLGSALGDVELRDTTANTKFPAPHANPHQGKGGFRIEVSRYLSNALFTGNSAKAWYLLADPSDLPVIETAFLNGQEAPTVETSDADFNMLGIRMRGYHDFPPTASTCRTRAASLSRLREKRDRSAPKPAPTCLCLRDAAKESAEILRWDLPIRPGAG